MFFSKSTASFTVLLVENEVGGGRCLLTDCQWVRSSRPRRSLSHTRWRERLAGRRAPPSPPRPALSSWQGFTLLCNKTVRKIEINQREILPAPSTARLNTTTRLCRQTFLFKICTLDGGLLCNNAKTAHCLNGKEFKVEIWRISIQSFQNWNIYVCEDFNGT